MANRPIPPHLAAALEQVQAALTQALGKPVNLLSDPWAEVERGVARLLGGAFDPSKPEHTAVALGLGAAFGERLAEPDQGFWFPNRDAPESAMVGFPDAVLMLSPLGAAAEALGQSKLELLDTIAADIRKALAQARFAPNAGQAQRLNAEAYRQLFDPGMLQFLVFDPAKADAAWALHPDTVSREIRDAISRAGSKLTPEVAKGIEQQIVGGMSRLDPAKSLTEQIIRAPRLVELVASLNAATAFTGVAPDDFWEGLAFPLLFIGAPQSFPPLDDEERQAVKQGIDPFTLFLDTVPYANPARDEGYLGAFDPDQVSLPHPAFGQLEAPHLLKVDRAAVTGLVEQFDADKTREALGRWTAYLEAEAGQKPVESEPATQLRDVAVQLLSDLKRLLTHPGDMYVRRMTEAEAQSEMSLIPLRLALQGPRIILAP